MKLGAAYALAESLHVHTRDKVAEIQTVKQLAAWAGRFTSMVSLVPPQALVLEIGGSLSFFGGLEQLIQQVQRKMIELGYHFNLAVAPTPLGATLLARVKHKTPVTDQQTFVSIVMQLPVSALELETRQYTALRKLGLRTIGDCLRLPREGLTRRLGAKVLLMLDRALGCVADPRKAFVAPPRFSSSLLLPAEVTDTEALLFAVRRLLLELVGVLESRSSGAQFLLLELNHTSKHTSSVTLSLVAPARDLQYLLDLFRERLERVTLQDAVREICLTVKTLLPLADCSHSLFHDSTDRADSYRENQQAWTTLIERLCARLGDDAIKGLCRVAEHRPERAWRYGMPGESSDASVPVQRPLWLLPEPERLSLKEGRPWFNGQLSLQSDRERIESGWWDGHDIQRDYFVAHNSDDVQLWIYRELTGKRRWFLHGVFG